MHNNMEIYTAQYTVRCNNNTCGLLCNLKIIYFGHASIIKILCLCENTYQKITVATKSMTSKYTKSLVTF